MSACKGHPFHLTCCSSAPGAASRVHPHQHVLCRQMLQMPGAAPHKLQEISDQSRCMNINNVQLT